jgi:TRAP-type uncharacterized transport system fused permease subunit
MSVVMKERGHLLLPLFAIIFFLGWGFTPLYAALMGLVVCVLTAQVRKSTHGTSTNLRACRSRQRAPPGNHRRRR